MVEDEKVICANRDCRVNETGRCVEGLDLAACPHYGHEPSDEEESSARDEAEGDAVGVRLPGADTLASDEATRLLRKNGGRVIAVIGPKGAGKTSLIASLYDLFQEGAVAEIEYARSETLHAFELACHDSRAASRRGEPDMARTPLGEVRFYHLDLAGGAAGDRVTLLLGDRAGEEYRLAADDVSNAPPFPEITRADTVTILIDGERLADTGARHNLRSEIIMTLQALHDGGALSGRQRLILVLTKLDAVQASPNQERAQTDFASLQSRITSIFGTAFRRIDACAVAASPRASSMARGTGVATILRFWVAADVPPGACRPPLSPSPRAFARLTMLRSSETEDA